MSAPDPLEFVQAVVAYIETADQQDLEVLVDALDGALSIRLGSYRVLSQAALDGLRLAIRRAHGAPGHERRA